MMFDGTTAPEGITTPDRIDELTVSFTAIVDVAMVRTVNFTRLRALEVDLIRERNFSAFKDAL